LNPNEGGPFLRENGREDGLIVPGLGKAVDQWEPSGSGQAGKVDDSGPGDGLVSSDLVVAVSQNEEDQVLGIGLCDGHQRPQRHEHAPVPIQADDAPLGLGECYPQCQIRRVPHGTVGRGKVQVMIGDSAPGASHPHAGDDDLVGPVAGQREKEFVFREHSHTPS